MGIHPWIPESNRCISMVILMVICFAAFVGELLKPLFDSKDVTKYYLLSLFLIFLFYEGRNNLFPRNLNKINKYYKMNTYLSFKKVDITLFNKIYVDRWEAPYVKYLYEYGELKHEIGKTYPNKYTFIKAIPHSSIFYDSNTLKEYYIKQPKMNELTTYDLLITPELYAFGNSDKWILMDGTNNFWIKHDK
jgi:hypothetical protein